MSFLPLTLGVGASGTGSSAFKTPGKSDIDATLKRDKNTCRYCGFQSAQFQRVIATGLSGADEFATSCHFCEQVRFLDRTGLAGGGLMIWLPEIGQPELNHIVRAIYVARADDDQSPVSEAALRALDVLSSRKSEAKKRLGSDDPLLLATVLTESLTGSDRNAAGKKLDGIRLLPANKVTARGKTGDVNAFPQIVKFWRSPQGPFAQLPTSAWQGLLDKLAA